MINTPAIDDVFSTIMAKQLKLTQAIDKGIPF
jgi:hypothetical protein